MVTLHKVGHAHIENGIPQGYQQLIFAFQVLTGHPECVANPFAHSLYHEGGIQFWIIFLYIVLYFFAQVADDEYKVLKVCFYQAIDDMAEDRLAGYGDQRFWLRVRVWAQAGSYTCYRYYS